MFEIHTTVVFGLCLVRIVLVAVPVLSMPTFTYLKRLVGEVR